LAAGAGAAARIGPGVQPLPLPPDAAKRPGRDPVPEPRTGPARSPPAPGRPDERLRGEGAGDPAWQARRARRAPRAGALPAVVLAARAPSARDARRADREARAVAAARSSYIRPGPQERRKLLRAGSLMPTMEAPRQAESGALTGHVASNAARRDGTILIGGHPTEEQYAG